MYSKVLSSLYTHGQKMLTWLITALTLTKVDKVYNVYVYTQRDKTLTQKKTSTWLNMYNKVLSKVFFYWRSHLAIDDKKFQ